MPEEEVPAAEARRDPVIDWRRRELERRGYAGMALEELTFNTQVDLHQAISLAEKAGVELAYEILR